MKNEMKSKLSQSFKKNGQDCIPVKKIDMFLFYQMPDACKTRHTKYSVESTKYKFDIM